MARTWTLHDTLTLNGSDIVYPGGFTAQDDDFQYVYFFSNNTVYQYDGTTLTDISGSSFTGVSDRIVDIAWYNENLYAIAGYSVGTGSYYYCKLHKWSGTGQVWVEVYTPDANQEFSYDLGMVSYTNSYMEYIDKDSNIFVLKSYVIPTDTLRAVPFITVDGINFNYCTSLSTIGNLTDKCYGENKGNTYQNVLLSDYSAGDDPWLKYDTGYNFVQLSAETGESSPVGYGNGYSFRYQFTAGTDEDYIVKTDDWLATPATRASDTQFSTANTLRIAMIGSETLMLWERGDEAAYTWDSETEQFIVDGAMGDPSHHIKSFFRIGSTIYALCLSGSTGSATIYGGGTIPIPAQGVGEFYYGIESLAKKADVSFSINPKGMAVNNQTNDVVIVSNIQQAIMAEQLLANDNYATVNDFTDGLDTDTDVEYNTVEYTYFNRPLMEEGTVTV